MSKFNLFIYLAPSLLVTIGFIDPGNWATNLAAGSSFGYSLLWVVSLSTIMLIILQHNVAKLGIITGKGLVENCYIHMNKKYAKPFLFTAFIASISTTFAEILGGAIALNFLLNIPLVIASFMMVVVVIIITFFLNYNKIEKFIISFLSIICLCFIYELTLIDVEWLHATQSSLTMSFPNGSLLIIAGILGAVIMPHNLFLHSEIITNKSYTSTNNPNKKKLLKSLFLGTLLAMLLGWMINCTIIILSAEVFFKNDIQVSELTQAALILEPLLGNRASIVFAVSLLCAGIASSITAGISGGVVFSNILNKQYDEQSIISKVGIVITLIIALSIVFFIKDPFMGLIYSQILLSMQLPLTIATQLYLTSSKKVMKDYKNNSIMKLMVVTCGIFVISLNILLLYYIFI